MADDEPADAAGIAGLDPPLGAGIAGLDPPLGAPPAFVLKTQRALGKLISPQHESPRLRHMQ